MNPWIHSSIILMLVHPILINANNQPLNDEIQPKDGKASLQWATLPGKQTTFGKQVLDRKQLLDRMFVNRKQPHILFILADDYGWNDIGYHGSEIRTPYLDKLAAEGVKLENYYVQPICTPSRSQLLSGRYQIHTGLQHFVLTASQPNGLPLELPTLADKLKEVGYMNHMVGKWHLGFFKKEYQPTYRGFNSFYGYLTGNEDYWTHIHCGGDPFHPEFKKYCGLDLHNGTQVVHDENGTYSARLYSELTEEIVRTHDKTKPLFMYLPLQSVHVPLQAPQEYIDKYKHIKHRGRRIYAGMVSIMDEAIKNVTDSFKKHGLWDNTIMIFSTDNGGPRGSANNWPLRGHKNTLWEGGVHGVGFVNSPLLKKSGYVNHEFMHISDWFPTLLSVAGGSTHGLQLDGYNQWNTISTNSSSPRKELLHNIDPLYPLAGTLRYKGTFDHRYRAAIRVGNWKLITGAPGDGSWIPPPDMMDNRTGSVLDESANLTQSLTLENKHKNLWLFNIKDDPTEHHDLSDKDTGIVKQLLDRLAQYNSTAVPCRFPDPDPQSNPDLHGGAWVPWRD